MDYIIDNTNCYLCRSSKYIIRPGTVRDNNKLKVLECSECGLVFLSSFKHIEPTFYEESKMHVKEKIFEINDWVRESHFDDERRYNDLKYYLKNRSVLDFGCGAGGFLKYAKNISKCAEGIEVEKRLFAYYKKNGLTVYNTLSEVKNQYDLITLFHVLEHFSDPIDLLVQLKQKLKRNGQIIIEVPNSNDALLTFYKSKAFSEFTYWSCHLFLFNNKTLVQVAERAGLKMTYVKQIQRYPLSNHLYWLVYGKPNGHEVWHHLNSHDIVKAYESSLQSLGICDTIIGGFSV